MLRSLLAAAGSLLLASVAPPQTNRSPSTTPTAAAQQPTVDSLRAQVARLATDVDSLRVRQERHQVQENFYGNALDEQANRFALIVGGLLGLAALVSWASFRHEVNRVRKAARNAVAEVEAKRVEMEGHFRRAETEALRDRVNLDLLIVQLAADQEQFHHAVSRQISASGYLVDLHARVPSPDNLPRLRSFVKRASHLADRFRRMQPSRRLAVSDYEAMLPTLRKLHAIDDEEVSALSSELRQKLRDLVAEPQEAVPSD